MMGKERPKHVELQELKKKLDKVTSRWLLIYTVTNSGANGRVDRHYCGYAVTHGGLAPLFLNFRHYVRVYN
jgi:hypothetical protein